MWTMTIPVLSTAHMPHEFAVVNITTDHGMPAAFYDDGCFIYIGNSDSPETRKCLEPGDTWLHKVAEWAWQTYGDDDCTWVRFDRDGDTVPELQTWEW